MKKGQMIILSICALSICLVVGIFLGRNLPSRNVRLAQHNIVNKENARITTETEIQEASQNQDGVIDLNNATKSQLMELPGIGEVIAQRIIEYRQEQSPFAAIEDLLNVKGIGEKKLEQIKPFVRVGG